MRISCLRAILVANALLIGVTSVNAQTTATSPSPPSSGRGTSVAVIDIGYIFRNLERFKQARDDINDDAAKFQQDVGERRAALAKQIEQLKSTPAGTPQYSQMEEQLANADTQLRLDMGRKQKERVEKEAKIYFNAYKEVEENVKRFSDRYGIDLVVRFNSEQMDISKPETVLQGINRFVVFQRSLNITNHVLDELNRGTPPPGVSSPQIPRGTRTR
ncbi:MAG: OmpH family outer membrane protein [Pirellulaceae bacterium]